MSKIKNGGLDQYGTERSKQRQFGTDGVEGVHVIIPSVYVNFHRIGLLHLSRGSALLVNS